MTDKNSLSKSEEEYSHIVSNADPTYVERALMQLAELNYNRGDYERSDSLAKKVIDGYPGGTSINDAFMRRALALQELSRNKEAVDEFLKVDIDSLTTPDHAWLQVIL